MGSKERESPWHSLWRKDEFCQVKSVVREVGLQDAPSGMTQEAHTHYSTNMLGSMAERDNPIGTGCGLRLGLPVGLLITHVFQDGVRSNMG